MLTRLRSLLPAPVKRPVRQALDAVDGLQRRRALALAAGALREQAAAGTVDPPTLQALRAAWSNTGYSADMSFAQELAARMLVSRGPFLECGSGFSTIVAGMIADACGTRVWSLEQDRAWYDTMRRALGTLGIRSVHLWHVPLRQYDDFLWFDLGRRRLPGEFTHAFCDGPSVERTRWPAPLYASWRVGLVPVLQGLGVRVGEILLDDAEDPRAPGLRARWSALGVETHVVSAATGSLVVSRPSAPR